MEQIEFKKMISVINKIDKENVENIVAFMPNGNIIIGNVNSFFVYRAGNKLKFAPTEHGEEIESVVIPMIHFPTCSASKHVAIDDSHIYVTPTDGVSITFPYPETLDEHSISSVDAIDGFLNEKIVPYLTTLGYRDFPSKLKLTYRVYVDVKKQLMQFMKIKNQNNCIYLTPKLIGNTDGHIVNYIEMKGDLTFSINYDVLEAMKLFGTPFNIHTANFPNNPLQQFFKDKDSEEVRAQRIEEASLPQIMLSNPKLDFFYTHTVKELPKVPDLKVVYPTEKPLYTFMVNNAVFNSICKLGTSNYCEFINFHVKNNNMFIWAMNDTEVVLNEKIPIYSTTKDIVVWFKMCTTFLVSSVAQTNDAYIKVLFYGMDRPIVFDDKILAITTTYELDIDEMKRDVEAIFGE